MGERPQDTCFAGASFQKGLVFVSKQKLRMWIGCGIVILGLLGMAYPFVSDLWNQGHVSRLIEDYEVAVLDMPDDMYTDMKIAAEAYNATLVGDERRFEVTDSSHAEYESLLDVTGTGIMCYIEIPALDVRLPVYHTTDETVLQVAVGHLEGSSLPVGGPSTHTAISGHSGLVTAQLFTSLEKLSVGNRFYIHVLDETRVYEVDEIHTVLPDETELLAITPGEDYVTLITCTPYGVNSHRLLVRGTFVGLQEEVGTVPEEVIQSDTSSVGLEQVMFCMSLVGTGILIFVLLLMRRRRKQS